MTLIPNGKAKTSALREKGIPRCISLDVSRLLVEYLVYVRPVQIMFTELFQLPGRAALSAYLFSEPERADNWDGDRVCIEFCGGGQLGIRQYRHVVIAFMRWHLRPELFSLHNDADSILDVQTGHTLMCLSIMSGMFSKPGATAAKNLACISTWRLRK
jgi:hypothetical protein